MKIAIVYASKTNHAKKYAEWINQVLESDMFSYKKINKSLLKSYDVIIYGGGLYATGILGFKRFIKKHYHNQLLFVYATGAAPGRASVLKEVFDNNFKQIDLEKLKFYYLRGGFDYTKLNFKDKLLMTLLKSKLRHKKKLNKPLNADEKGMLKAYERPVDFTREKFILPLVEDIKNLKIKKKIESIDMT